jgi:flagellar protein FliS
MVASGAARYREVEVLTMQPAQRVVLLYSHLLSNLRQAKLLTEQREFEARAERLGRAQDIVQELVVSLDHEAGGQIAGSLDSLYAFFLAEMIRLGAAREAGRFDPLIRMVTELHGAWAQAATQVTGASLSPA